MHQFEFFFKHDLAIGAFSGGSRTWQVPEILESVIKNKLDIDI